MPDLVSCPHCGASNPFGAGWCGQCLRRFGAAEDERRRNGTPATAVRTLRAEAGPAVEVREGAEPVWTCPACDTENELSASACVRCGSLFTSFFAPPSAGHPPRTSAGTAVGLSALLPGAGHWVHREVGPAVARAVLYVWAVGIAVMLLGWPPRGARALVRGVGTIFALAAVGVWLVSLLETMRFGEGDRRPLIPPKVLTWFTAGLSALLFVGLLTAVFVSR